MDPNIDKGLSKILIQSVAICVLLTIGAIVLPAWWAYKQVLIEEGIAHKPVVKQNLKTKPVSDLVQRDAQVQVNSKSVARFRAKSVKSPFFEGRRVREDVEILVDKQSCQVKVVAEKEEIAQFNFEPSQEIIESGQTKVVLSPDQVEEDLEQICIECQDEPVSEIDSGVNESVVATDEPSEENQPVIILSDNDWVRLALLVCD